MAENPRKNRVECLQKFRPKLIVGIAFSFQSIIRPKISSIMIKIRKSFSFCKCDCPDWFCQCQTSAEDVASSLNVFMGSMVTLHAGRLQVYICSREGQIQNKLTAKRPALLRKCQRDMMQTSVLELMPRCGELRLHVQPIEWQAVPSLWKLWQWWWCGWGGGASGETPSEHRTPGPRPSSKAWQIRNRSDILALDSFRVSQPLSGRRLHSGF